ncbi:MAG: TerB family tellurite resistance protein [Bacteroidales bacterium]|jgi:DnaJ like chaperone protein|nr:TerB family tellurite resistance protein [Bacteroidales bacterium]
MEKLAKWIGAGLGLAFFGPIGMIIGFALGNMLSPQKLKQLGGAANSAVTGNYVASLLVLVAAVMKADGKVMKSELDYVKTCFRRWFGDATATEALRMLRDLLKQNIPVADVCRQIHANMDYEARLQLVHFLYGIAVADNSISENEQQLLMFMAATIGLSPDDTAAILNMYVKNTDSAYKILGISPSASIDDIKRAYRTMAMKFHPDKVSYLGEEIQSAAKEKFQRVNEAYETIKKERNFQ